MQILIIEDDPDHIELERKICIDAIGADTEIDHSPALAEGLEKLVSNSYDVCLCDLSFPGSSAKETITQLQSLKGIPHAPVIILTSFTDEANAVNLLHHGIQDYILKSELSTQQLRRIITFAVERQRYQELLEERNRDQEAFCRSLSHDFRGKLGNIRQTAELLKTTLDREQKLTEKQTEWFGYIEDSSDHMLSLVDGLTIYLRADQSRAEFEMVPLMGIAEQVVKSLIEENALPEDAVSIECSRDLELPGDATQLYLILQNLVNNGIKFSQPAPKLVVSASPSEDGQTVEIRVTDNGVGMTGRQIHKIFEPFQRAHENYQGTGLGLSIVNRLVQRHKGSIEVSSEPNQGSTFLIRLPAS